MREHGIENVRGGSYSRLELDGTRVLLSGLEKWLGGTLRAVATIKAATPVTRIPLLAMVMTMIVVVDWVTTSRVVLRERILLKSRRSSSHRGSLHWMQALPKQVGEIK